LKKLVAEAGFEPSAFCRIAIPCRATVTFAPIRFDAKRPLLIFVGQILPDGAAFTLLSTDPLRGRSRPKLLPEKRTNAISHERPEGIGQGCDRVGQMGANRLNTKSNAISRRTFAHLAAIAGVGGTASSNGIGAPPVTVSLFDGKTLNGWVLLENTVYRVSRYDILGPAIFVGKIAKSADPVSGFVRSALMESLRKDLSTYSAATANVTLPALVNEINLLLTGPSIYDAERFRDVTLRPETKRLLAQKLQGLPLAHLNKLLLEDAYPTDLVRNPAAGWIVKDGAMASTGAGRGVIYTAKDYTHYRLVSRVAFTFHVA
jgi:hypothetical protein